MEPTKLRTNAGIHRPITINNYVYINRMIKLMLQT